MFAVKNGRAMNFLDASSTSAFGSEPPVAVPFEVPPALPPDSELGSLHPNTTNSRTSDTILSFFIGYPPAIDLSNLQKLLLQNDTATDGFRRSARTAEIP